MDSSSCVRVTTAAALACAAALSIGAFTLAGCSSTTTNNTLANCGAGTELRDGVCVAVADTSPADDTSSNGDSAPADGGLRSDSSAPEAGDDATPIDSTVTDSTVPETAVDAGKDSAPLGDPCPARVDVDCSGACGGDSSKCAIGGPYTCVGKVMAPKALVTTYDQLPFTIRLPEHPGTDPACQPRCGAGNTVWGFGVAIQIPGARADGIRIKVNPPWQVYPYDVYNPYCIEAAKPGGSCLYADGSSMTWFIATTDPKADARNATIEWVPAGGARCP